MSTSYVDDDAVESALCNVLKCWLRIDWDPWRVFTRVERHPHLFYSFPASLLHFTSKPSFTADPQDYLLGDRVRQLQHHCSVRDSYNDHRSVSFPFSRCQPARLFWHERSFSLSGLLKVSSVDNYSVEHLSRSENVEGRAEQSSSRARDRGGERGEQETDGCRSHHPANSHTGLNTAACTVASTPPHIQKLSPPTFFLYSFLPCKVRAPRHTVITNLISSDRRRCCKFNPSFLPRPRVTSVPIPRIPFSISAQLGSFYPSCFSLFPPSSTTTTSHKESLSLPPTQPHSILTSLLCTICGPWYPLQTRSIQYCPLLCAVSVALAPCSSI
jgi:hypothetical protein